MAATPGRRTEDTMTRWAILAIPALCLPALAACGSPPGSDTFMSATASEVVFIQWQTGDPGEAWPRDDLRDHGHLLFPDADEQGRGAIDAIFAKPLDPADVSSVR
jgi:hypothetical protein